MTDRQKWLEWRQKGIGSSDAPIIMGKSPWKTKFELYEEKVAETVEEDDSNSYIKQKGNEFEPRVRALYELLTDDEYPEARVQSEQFEFLRASLDGRSKKYPEKLIEIKLLGLEDWTAMKELSKVPEKYVPQVQHQLLVANAEVCVVLGYLYEKGAKAVEVDNLCTIPIYTDLQYQGQLLEEEVKFWDCVTKKKPPILGDKDYAPLKGHAKILNAWRKQKLKVEKEAEKLDVLREQLIAAATAKGHPRFEQNGVRMRIESRAGSVDYKKVLKYYELNPDAEFLDKFRGKGSTSWKIEALDE